MDRIVYFSFPAHGHMNPVLPVLRELVRHRYDIACYSTASFQPGIQQTGAVFHDYGPQFRIPDRSPGPFARVSTTLEVLLALTVSVLQHCLEPARRLRPNLVMFDSFAPWGRLIAQILGLPAVASVPSILINADIDRLYRGVPETPDPQLTPEWYAGFALRCRDALRPYGFCEYLSPPQLLPQLLQSYGDLNLVYTSRMFQPLVDAFDPRHFRFVGPCLEFRPNAPDFPFEQLDGHPLVFVSLGTIYGDRPGFLRQLIQELSDAPWQVILSTDQNLEQLGPLPNNFLVRPFVPQIEILQRAAAFLSHGGMNSVQEALYFGVPLVLSPQAADQFWISSRVEELGAGIVLSQRPETGAIRAALTRVISQPGYAAAACRIAESLRAGGGAPQAASEINGFLHSRFANRPFIETFHGADDTTFDSTRNFL
jgi:MGT family glycosyltransferase